ncbi:MAG: hypothetical protein KatS3mg033_0702 [Thermonema sp.]|jgi:hypothetical protein|uniref:hypothetical protein n=1 Tax=Thermonema TaxID=28194 RepID=UPI0005720220|nr:MULTISPECIES: hypothetical protein [Thermonema]GIV38902.1 MAG: hypothetical protein KatS3mg033_0702 [Thermonema sp.]
MSIRYNKPFLQKLEELLSESGYILRYEKGNFQAGYCILKSQRIIVVNKFFTLEGKINCLIDIIRSLNIDDSQLSEAGRKLLLQIRQLSLS